LAALFSEIRPVTFFILYLRYSKRRYLKFYRFQMKCFLHEALTCWGYAPRQCIIDNTNLARLRGTGAQAVIVPEMESWPNCPVICLRLTKFMSGAPISTAMQLLRVTTIGAGNSAPGDQNPAV
jgi:hypothetical protein